MNKSTNTPQSKNTGLKHRWLGIALAVIIGAQAAPTLPAQAANLQQVVAANIDNAAIVEISLLYPTANNPNPSRNYQAQWMQLFRDVAPNWRFARALRHTTCLPAPAYDGNFAQNPGSSLKNWPIPGQSGCTLEQNTQEMITYVDPRLCDANTLRIGYWLYFKKDGFSGIGTGHRHDWEGTIVELKRQGGGASPVWAYSQIRGSFHHGYNSALWSDSFLEKTPDGKHPVMFVGWAHHAMHYTKGGAATLYEVDGNDLRNSYINLDAWNNLVVIPLESQPAQNILRNGDFGAANPPLTKDICAIP